MVWYISWSQDYSTSLYISKSILQNFIPSMSHTWHLYCFSYFFGHLVIFTSFILPSISRLWWAKHGILKITLHFCLSITSISILSFSYLLSLAALLNSYMNSFIVLPPCFTLLSSATLTDSSFSDSYSLLDVIRYFGH